MSVEAYTEWLRRQGYRVIHRAGSYWYNQGPRVYQAFPYHWCIQPTEEDLRAFLIEEKVTALRYSTELEAAEGKISYHVIFKDSPYNLQTLGANARSKVRRGLKRCRVERISIATLADDGWRLQEDTLRRQGRIGGMKQNEWRQLCLAAESLAGFEAWGALVDEKLAASILTASFDGVCYMLYPQSHQEYFSAYVNNALSYELSHEMLSRPDTRMVFYGLHSLDAPASMDEFKLRMGYQAKPVRQRVVFHPLLEKFIGRTGAVFEKTLFGRYPNNAFLRKVEGMLRFHIDGKRAPDEQNWPECLRPNRAELLQSLNHAAH